MPSPGWRGYEKCAYDSVADAVSHMKSIGIEKAVFNTWQGVFCETADDVREANDRALELFREFNGYLYPGAVIHPMYPEVSIECLKRFRDEGILWVGELVFYRCGIHYNKPSWLKLFEYCASNGHAVQLHNHESIIDVADRFPETRVICSHINLPLLEPLAQRNNVWIDMSGRCGGFEKGALERALELFGADRVLFGSDFTVYEPEAFIARLEEAVDSEVDREKISSLNIQRLLRKTGSRPIL
jgi:hypothetical protein